MWQLETCLCRNHFFGMSWVGMKLGDLATFMGLGFAIQNFQANPSVKIHWRLGPWRGFLCPKLQNTFPCTQHLSNMVWFNQILRFHDYMKFIRTKAQLKRIFGPHLGPAWSSTSSATLLHLGIAMKWPVVGHGLRQLACFVAYVHDLPFCFRNFGRTIWETVFDMKTLDDCITGLPTLHFATCHGLSCAFSANNRCLIWTRIV